VADEKNMRMGGYPSKPKSLAFLNRGALARHLRANGVVVWPFAGATGPMGKQAAEVGYDEAGRGGPRGRRPVAELGSPRASTTAGSGPATWPARRSRR